MLFKLHDLLIFLKEKNDQNWKTLVVSKLSLGCQNQKQHLKTLKIALKNNNPMQIRVADRLIVFKVFEGFKKISQKKFQLESSFQNNVYLLPKSVKHQKYPFCASNFHPISETES